VECSQEELDANLDAAVSAARRQIAREYPIVVDTTCWRWRSGELRVRGGVLSRAQGIIYQRVLGEQLNYQPIPEPLVLSSLDSLWQLHRWLPLVGEAPIDLLQSPKGELQTQWRSPAWLRHFADDSVSGHVLVQVADGTLGWVEAERLNLHSPPPEKDPWGNYLRPALDSAVPPAKGSPCDSARPLANAQLAHEARKWLSRGYLWGGNTVNGVDCSGFVQTLLLRCAGVLLPKNTGDQQRYGTEAALDELRAGDLIFVTGREQRLRHVALVVEAVGDPTTLCVIHASMSRGKVLEERLDIFLPRHDFNCARRVLHWPEET
jgi:hypothetical protein